MDETSQQFTKLKNNLQIVIKLENKESVLTIHMKDWQELESYELQIDYQYIKNHTDMSCFFQSPLDLYSTLKELFDNLQIKEGGIIVLNINLNALKINKTKQYVLKMSESNKAKNQMYKISLQKLKKEYNQHKNKDLAIKILLQDQIQNMKSQIATLKRQQIAKEQQINRQQNQKQQKQIQINQQSAQILNLQSLCGQLKQQIQKLTNQNQSHKNQISQLKITIAQLKQQEIKKVNYINEQNPHLYNFHYKYTDKSLIVTKKSENGWANFICNQVIMQNSSTKFTMKLLKMRDGSILLGVATKSIYGNNNLDHNEVIGYFCRDGRLIQNCLRKACGPPVTVSQTLTITVDRKTQKVQWSKQGKRIVEEDIPFQMKNKQLFFVAILFWKEDQFQLFL